jgi:hypothetical protein
MVSGVSFADFFESLSFFFTNPECFWRITSLAFVCAHGFRGSQFTCFTSTKVQILTPEEMRRQIRSSVHETQSGLCVNICTFVLVKQVN